MAIFIHHDMTSTVK